jgi:hypothetical protein
MPSYSFEAVDNGFSCTVNALGLSASATAGSNQVAKTEAAGLLLERLRQARVHVVECDRVGNSTDESPMVVRSQNP